MIRPENCRNERQAQGKSYPKSGCAVCGNDGRAGCPYEKGLDAASLARLKAEWQAEALERYSRIITEEWIDKGQSYGLRTASGQALLQAKEIRRQAEEGDT